MKPINCPKCGAKPSYVRDDDGNWTDEIVPGHWQCDSFDGGWTFIERYDCVKRQRDAIAKRVPVMLAALEFYANRENWKEVETGVGCYPGDAIDYGAKARAALLTLDTSPAIRLTPGR